MSFSLKESEGTGELTLKVNVTTTNDVRILGFDERPLEKLLWCALSFRMDRLLWADGFSSAWKSMMTHSATRLRTGISP